MKLTFKILVLFFGLNSFTWARNAPITCYIQSYDGHYLTAVGGGGRTTDVIHSNVSYPGAFERFTIVDTGEGSSLVGIKTYYGYYLTAIDGGGRITNVIQSNRTQLLNWEKFRLIALGNNRYAFQTFNGHYLTAVDSGGRTTDVIHSDATWIRTWETFELTCGI